MYKNILVPVAFDHDKSEVQALAIARSLLADNGNVTLFHVVEEIPGYILTQLPKDTVQKSITNAAEKLDAMAESAPMPVKTAVAIGHSSTTILKQLDDMGADCVVISSHKPGMGDYFIGSTAARVVRHAKCGVHVIR